MRAIKALLQSIDAINQWISKLASYVVIAFTLVIMYEVIMRFVFNSPTNWGHTVAELAFGIYLILGGGYLLREGSHIKVDILWKRFSLRKRAAVDLGTGLFALLAMGALVWSSYSKAAESLRINEHMFQPFSPPLFPFRIFLVIGSSLFFLALIAKFIRDIYTVAKGAEL